MCEPLCDQSSVALAHLDISIRPITLISEARSRGDSLLPTEYNDSKLYIECRLASVYLVNKEISPRTASNVILAWLLHLQFFVRLLMPAIFSIGLMFVSTRTALFQRRSLLTTEALAVDINMAQVPVISAATAVAFSSQPKQANELTGDIQQAAPPKPRLAAPSPPGKVCIDDKCATSD